MTRLNLCTNPSFENNATDWNVYATHATVARSTSHPSVGTHSGQVTWAAESDVHNQTFSPFAAVIGQTYTLSIDVYVPSGNPPLLINFKGAETRSTLFDQKQRLSVTAVASVSTENLVVFPSATGSHGSAPAGGVAFLDAALFERAPVALPYFDGTFAGATWSGTAGNSTSTLTSPPAITVSNDPMNIPPRNILFVTDSPGSTVTITRTDPDGAIRPVRTAEAAPLIGGTWSGFDYESPFDPTGSKNVTYTAQPSDGSAPFTATVPALRITQSWLIHPGVPDLSQPITILDADPGETFDSGATVHNVLGRGTPVIVTDGVRRSAASSVTIATDTVAQRQALEALLADTSPLLLQAVVQGSSASSLFPNLTLYPGPAIYPGGVSDSFSTYDWLAIDQVTRDRAGAILADPFRRWLLPYRVVDRPAGGVAAQRTWADLMADAATWSAVLEKFSTWNGALTGTPGA